MWNMAYKPRSEKDEIKILRSLNARMSLSEQEKRHYNNLVKGFEGEVMFDLLTEKLSDGRLVLNDLLLEVNNTKFQIDTTIISQEKTHLFEVKNFEGDFDYNSEKFYTIYGKEINNPLDQLKRCESLFLQLLQNHGYRIPIEGQVVFINPEFTLYQTPKNQPIIFPTQINRFMKKLNAPPSKLNGSQRKLAELLVSLHQIESPYARLRHYEYEPLWKGMLCAICHSFLDSLDEKELVCGHCGNHEKVESAVLRSVGELKLLFPDMKITTNVVHEWCKMVESKHVIREMLKKNYKVMGYGRWFYYE
jgi:hypothetical protein